MCSLHERNRKSSAKYNVYKVSNAVQSLILIAINIEYIGLVFIKRQLINSQI